MSNKKRRQNQKPKGWSNFKKFIIGVVPVIAGIIAFSSDMYKKFIDYLGIIPEMTARINVEPINFNDYSFKDYTGGTQYMVKLSYKVTNHSGFTATNLTTDEKFASEWVNVWIKNAYTALQRRIDNNEKLPDEIMNEYYAYRDQIENSKSTTLKSGEYKIFDAGGAFWYSENDTNSLKIRVMWDNPNNKHSDECFVFKIKKATTQGPYNKDGTHSYVLTNDKEIRCE